MLRQSCILFLAVCLFPLTGCRNTAAPISQPADPSSAPTSVQAVEPVPAATATPSLVPTAKAVEMMIAPEGTKSITLQAGQGGPEPPPGFRQTIIHPVGGMEDMNFCETTPDRPTLVSAPTEYEALEKNAPAEKKFLTCGWKDGETVQTTLTRPDGSVETISRPVEVGSGISYSPTMEYGMQLGDYSISFKSPSGELTAVFKILWPTSPGMNKMDTENQYLVYGFKPGERAVILAYHQKDNNMEVNAWQETDVDERGLLLIDDQSGSSDISVVGNESGAVWSRWFIGLLVGDNLYYRQAPACEGAPASRLQPYSLAVVTENEPNNIRSGPSTSAVKIGLLEPGTVLLVQKEQPVCADGYLWWKVAPNGKYQPNGWTAEGKGSDYWLEPYPAPDQP